MPAHLDSLLLACKQAEARHETAYALVSMLPSHDPSAPEWAPVWANLKQLTAALATANTTYLEAIRGRETYQRRLRTAAACPITPLDLHNAASYEVKYIVSAPEATTANAA